MLFAPYPTMAEEEQSPGQGVEGRRARGGSDADDRGRHRAGRLLPDASRRDPGGLSVKKPTTIDFETEAITDAGKPPKPVGVAIMKPRARPRVLRMGPPGREQLHRGGGPRSAQGGLGRAPPVSQRLLRHRGGLEAPWAPDPADFHDSMFTLYLVDPHADTICLKPASVKHLGMAARGAGGGTGLADRARHRPQGPEGLGGLHLPGPRGARRGRMPRATCCAPGGCTTSSTPPSTPGCARPTSARSGCSRTCSMNEMEGMRLDVDRLE